MIDVHQMPKIDLHHHFDGAFQVSSLYEEAKRRGLKQGNLSFEEFRKKATVGPECRSLTEFLATFHFFYDIAADIPFLRRSATELVQELKRQNFIYAETRFAPHLFTNAEADVETVVKEVLAGLTEGHKIQNQIHVRLILCLMRGSSIQQLKEIVDLAEKYRNDGVCGIDLAGDESKFDGSEYAEEFSKAAQRGIPVTIHAGEAAGPESVRLAVEKLGAKRIGHGINSLYDEGLMQDLIAKEITLEVCLTSNIQTATVSSLAKHPLPEFLKRNVPVTLNTDDPSVSAITLADEWELAIAGFNLSLTEIRKILETSARSSFTNAKEQANLLKIIADFFEKLPKS